MDFSFLGKIFDKFTDQLGFTKKNSPNVKQKKNIENIYKSNITDNSTTANNTDNSSTRIGPVNFNNSVPLPLISDLAKDLEIIQEFLIYRVL